MNAINKHCRRIQIYVGLYQREQQELINRFNTDQRNNNILFLVYLNKRLTATRSTTFRSCYDAKGPGDPTPL